MGEAAAAMDGDGVEEEEAAEEVVVEEDGDGEEVEVGVGGGNGVVEENQNPIESDDATKGRKMSTGRKCMMKKIIEWENLPNVW